MSCRLPGTEALKLACLAALVVLFVVVDRLALPAVLLLSLAHLGWLAVAGYCLLRVCRLRLPRSPADALALCYLLGWSTLGLFGLAARAHGQVGLEVPVLLAAGLALSLLWPPCREQEEALPTVPWGLYALSLAYVILSVLLPFAFFSADSIVREFYGDGVQRFAVIYALGDRVPPANPFMAAMPLRYYWLGMLPYAAEYRWVWPDLFAVWRCGQAWTALLLLPALWLVVRSLARCPRVAWWTVVLAFVCASWEALVHPAWREGAAALRQDPDMLRGIVQPWSDQLLLEDFLYIPHNAWALSLVLGSVWLLARGRIWGALPGLAALAATNTFFALPAAAGYAVCVLACRRLPEALAACAAFACAVAAALGLVGILPAWTLWGVGAGAVLALVCCRGGGGRACGETALAAAAVALLLALAALLLPAPGRHPLTYLLNYGPAAVAGVWLLGVLVRRGGGSLPQALRCALLFLLSAAAVVLLSTAFLQLADAAWAPAAVRGLAQRAGETLNPFNFYHKTAKLVRLTWALLGALALVRLSASLGPRPLRRPLAWALALALLASTLTTVWRPLTYAFGHEVAEAPAARYLRAQHVSARTVVLAEDYRGTQLPMLLPVTLYCYSQWGEGNLGLSTRRGTWLDQYLPPALRVASRPRELAVERFFSPAATTAERAALLRAGGVRYVLTRKPWEPRGLARPVLSGAGVWLYEAVGSGPLDQGAGD